MRLIDADVLISFMRKGWRLFPSSELRHTCDITDVESAPTIDAVPVVRCKDCKHRDPEDHKCDCGALERAGCMFPVSDDYFCSYGERRENG